MVKIMHASTLLACRLCCNIDIQSTRLIIYVLHIRSHCPLGCFNMACCSCRQRWTQQCRATRRRRSLRGQPTSSRRCQRTVRAIFPSLSACKSVSCDTNNPQKGCDATSRPMSTHQSCTWSMTRPTRLVHLCSAGVQASAQSRG